MRQLCGTYLFCRHIGKQVVAIDLLVALYRGYCLFVLILLLVNLSLHLRHLLQLVHLALVSVGFQLLVVHLLLTVALVSKAVVLQFLVASEQMVFLIYFALAHKLLEVVVVFLGLAVTLAVVFFFLLHPLALTFFVFDAPVAAALQVFAFPVMVGARVVESPFCFESCSVDVLLTLYAHYLRYLLTRNSLVCKLVFEHLHLLLLHEAVAAKVFQSLKLFLLGLCLTYALLAFEHLHKLV